MDYDDLKRTIADYRNSRDVFGMNETRDQPVTSKERTSVASNLDSLIDSLTAQLSELRLIIMKMDSTATGGGEIWCGFWKKEDHSANKSGLNPDKDMQCNICRRYGHRVTNCWTKKAPKAQKSDAANVVLEYSDKKNDEKDAP
jgi:hypothetical protein